MRDGSTRRAAVRAIPALRGLLLTVAVLATMRPVPMRAAEDQREECKDDAILIVDASGSMASADPHGNVSRIHRVRQAAAEVVPQVAPTRNLGLMVYGGGLTNGCGDIALKVAPGPNNAASILDALRDLLPNGRTRLSESVVRAAEALKFRTRPATIVLLTDGELVLEAGDECDVAHTACRPQRVEEVAHHGRVDVYVLGLGFLAQPSADEDVARAQFSERLLETRGVEKIGLHGLYAGKVRGRPPREVVDRPSLPDELPGQIVADDAADASDECRSAHDDLRAGLAGRRFGKGRRLSTTLGTPRGYQFAIRFEGPSASVAA